MTNDVDALGARRGLLCGAADPKAQILADMRILSAGPAELWLDTEPDALDAGAASTSACTRSAARSRSRPHRRARDPVADRAARRRGRRAAGPRSRSRPPSTSGSMRAWATACQARRHRRRRRPDARRERAGTLRDALLRGGRRAVSATRRPRSCAIERGQPAPRRRHGRRTTCPARPGIVERAVSFTKGCYVGQEPVARMYHRGHPNRHLRGLDLSAAGRPGTSVMSADKEVGRLTSSVTSPRLRADRARDRAAGGRGRRPGRRRRAAVGATVVEFPFDGS